MEGGTRTIVDNGPGNRDCKQHKFSLQHPALCSRSDRVRSQVGHFYSSLDGFFFPFFFFTEFYPRTNNSVLRRCFPRDPGSRRAYSEVLVNPLRLESRRPNARPSNLSCFGGCDSDAWTTIETGPAECFEFERVRGTGSLRDDVCIWRCKFRSMVQIVFHFNTLTLLDCIFCDARNRVGMYTRTRWVEKDPKNAPKLRGLCVSVKRAIFHPSIPNFPRTHFFMYILWLLVHIFSNIYNCLFPS